jgi:3-methylfumaryl-CoA hydratase
VTSVTMTEYLTPEPAKGLAGLLDLPTDPITDGWPLPPLWHRVYLLERPAQSTLGPEGHPVHGIPEPPRPGLRRMYAGGRVTTHRPLRLGREATSTIEVADTRERSGRSGWMTIVTTKRTIAQDGATAITDEVDIIYREPTPLPPADAPSPRAQASGTLASGSQPSGAEAEEQAAEEHWSFDVDETVLFRFSALTFNAHRIHYDIDYCRNEEGYEGLVVHGPLQALLMAQQAVRSPAFTSHAGTAPWTFSYRLVSPLILRQGLVVGRSDGQSLSVATSVRDKAGRRTAVGLLRWD